MPYIRPQDQQRILTSLSNVLLGTKGELCFAINVLQMKFAETHFSEITKSQKVDYQTLSDCVSAANDANTEFYRRVIFPYEDHKIRENGDIFREFIRKANI